VDVAIAANGNVLVADTGNYRLQEFTPAGQFVASYDSIAGSPTPTFSPVVVTAAPSGDIYLFDGQANVRRIVRVRAGSSAPVLGEAVNVAKLNGTVLVDLPGGGGFVPLEQARQIPVGSVLDTRRGKVALTSARDRQGRTQKGQFGGGVFQVRQGRRSGGLTELRLRGGEFGRCGRRARGALAAGGVKRVIRQISASSRRGRFRTRGRYSASTVRGTVWGTIDRCDGTLTRVRKGSVVVRDLRRNRNVVVRAGQSYLAQAPGA
jgi:NHL repeat